MADTTRTKHAFTAEDVAKAKQFLQRLPKVEKPKPERKYNVAELIGDLRSDIRAALRRGQPLEDIVDGLNRTYGWKLKASSVKSYLNRRTRTKSTAGSKAS